MRFDAVAVEHNGEMGAVRPLAHNGVLFTFFDVF